MILKKQPSGSLLKPPGPETPCLDSSGGPTCTTEVAGRFRHRNFCARFSPLRVLPEFHGFFGKSLTGCLFLRFLHVLLIRRGKKDRPT